ncbi:MAG: type II toxin-antitoxin system MqsA family antitoxin [Faecalibacterium sp.]|nr:type II toxin-antitoxin system MqsA family antitoxin [Ruminococcus sp.]MCM1485301.1 type II toxin-antitoxin system MqsA family antitoxin [Faecalibacterium sp.]
MIKRKHFIISYIIAAAGFMFVLACTFLDGQKDEKSVVIFLSCAFVLFVIYGLYKSHTCKCPHCGAGHLFDVTTYYWKCDTLKREFVCPECGKTVYKK